MKQIKVYCDRYGKVRIDNPNVLLSHEHNAVSVEISMSGLGLTSFLKRVDILVGKDKTVDYLPKVNTTGDVFTITLEEEHYKSGYLRIQPIAYTEDQLGAVTKKIKWEVVELKVQFSIDVMEVTANVEPSLGAILQSEVNTLKDTAMLIDGSNSNVDVLSFNSETVVALQNIGQVRYNADLRTLECKITDDVTIQIGKEVVIEAMNKEVDTISNGKAVYISGGAGANAYCKRATTVDNEIAFKTIGLATEDITPNEKGHITTVGLVNGVDTTAFNEGDILYLDVDGALTNVEPTKPTPNVVVGVCLRSQLVNGVILVGVRVMPRLEQLSNVSMGDGEAGDVLVLNENGVWVNSNYLTVPRYNDIVFEFTPTRINPSTSKPDYDYTNVGFLFPQNIPSEIIYLTVQLPHSWKEGTTIYPHVHVRQSANQQAVFKADYLWYNAGDTIPTVWETYIMNEYAMDYVSGSISQIVKGASGIDGTGKKISSILKIKLYRDDNVYVGDMLADQFDIHIEIDAFGSTQQYIK